MYTAMLTLENLHGAGHDVWSVNTDSDYHEEQRIGEGRTPQEALSLDDSRLAVEPEGSGTAPAVRRSATGPLVAPQALR